ncbi:hypothetical protein P885DRAFT_42755 [Corynascus similis CBS 632.67]
MPPRKGRWPFVGAKASQGRNSASRGKLRDFVSTSPKMESQSTGFSMRDEAKHTASHQSFMAWASGDAKLRQKPVAFVSAGFIEPLKEETTPEDPLEPKQSEEPSKHVIEDMDATVDAVTAGDIEDASDSKRVTAATVGVGTIAERAGKEGLDTEYATQSVNDLNLPPKDGGSGEKELFFFDFAEDEPPGDPTIPPPKIPSPRSSFSESDSSEEIILFRGRTANSQRAASRVGNPPPNATPAPLEEHPERHTEVISSVTERQNAQGTTPLSQPEKRRSRAQRRRSRNRKAMKDDDEDAILADYIANMAADSDNEFTASHNQLLPGHRDLGGDDDAVNFGFTNEQSSKGGSSGDEEEMSVSDTSIADMDADMGDEALARLLAKQEELGMGGDELLIFSSSFAKTGTRQAQGRHSVKTGSTRALREPASATQVADAFDNLDLADWGHLTGQTRKQRSKRPPNFNAFDSDIEAALKTAWQRDRERKKSRKLEREALRAEGLLDKKATPDDLRVKYLSGMKLDEIKLELTSFLVGSAERLEFPPLDKHARKILHELASKFDIKSQSTGKGDQRRPVLYRTKRTVQYASTRVEDAASHVDQQALRIHRKYFHRVDVKAPRTGSPRNTGGGRSGHKALTLREGEVVGASVPELSQDNKGRTMLEKMGWSKGMSLGALDNQGILEPVAQVMKRSKAGLG